MSHINDPLRVLVQRAKALLDEEDFERALEVLQQAEDRSGEHGLTVSWVFWAKCVALDLLGRTVEALAAVDHALQRDASSAPAYISREIVLRRLRELLVNTEASLTDRLAAYDALANANETGYAEYVARVDLLRSIGRYGDALDVALSVEALWPTIEIRRRILAIRAELS